MEISIKKGEGISQAIKRQLNKEGIQDNQFTGSVWSKIQQSLNDGASVLKHGSKETKIGELWTQLSQNVMTYVDDCLKIVDSTWNNIKKLFTGTSGGAANPTNPSPADTNPTDDNQPVTTPKITLKEKYCNYNSDRTADGKGIAKKLKELLSKTPVPMGEVKELLNKIDREIIAYVVQAYPQLADDIDGVFRFGFGFDKKDVYDFVLKPLVDRAKAIKIKVPNGINKEISLDEMKKYIKQLSGAIINEEKTWDVANKEYNEKLPESQKRIDNALDILTKAANSESPNITKFESSRNKWCRLSDGTSIWARYDDSGEICSVQIDTDDKDDVTDVCFTKDGVSFDNDENPTGSFKYNNCPVEGYNYNDILALAQRIFGKWED